MMPTERSEGSSVALVTGAAQGIGFGIASALAGAGHRVALADVRGEQVVHSAARIEAERGVETLGLPIDVTKADDWKAGIERIEARWGRLDLLVNCAGISPRGTVETTDEALWDLTLNINLKGAWLGIKAALPMLRRGRGSIINIGSTRATRPMPGLFSYVVSKAGLLGLTRQVAAEYLDSGVRCNLVSPGWVDTPGERELQARHGLPDFPAGLRNIVTTEEIGAAVAYLASPSARNVNGVNLLVDAGLHIADDAGMVFLPDRTPPPYRQRID
ncbi:MAG: dehydrogenase [Planctomycetes bacterium SCN 63-9]|nr:MAG: dehydrogenase [Planctomycetes bacterium SCN 63-9]